MTMGYPKSEVTGAVLAGGRGQRMGGVDKGLLELTPGRPLIDWVVTAIHPQVSRLLISANRNADRYRQWTPDVIGDDMPGFPGPLAGVASCLHACETPLMLTAPCDCPMLAPDLAVRLHASLRRAGAQAAVAHDGDRLQPAFALVSKSLEPKLRAYLAQGFRRLDGWLDPNLTVIVDFSDQRDSFTNVNTPDELTELEARILLQRQ